VCLPIFREKDRKIKNSLNERFFCEQFLNPGVEGLLPFLLVLVEVILAIPQKLELIIAMLEPINTGERLIE
jgi:hypothetical protein